MLLNADMLLLSPTRFNSVALGGNRFTLTGCTMRLAAVTRQMVRWKEDFAGTGHVAPRLQDDVFSDTIYVLTPDSTKGVMDTVAQSSGEYVIKVGPTFQISVAENAGDIAQKKADITNDDVYTVPAGREGHCFLVSRLALLRFGQFLRRSAGDHGIFKDACAPARHVGDLSEDIQLCLL